MVSFVLLFIMLLLGHIEKQLQIIKGF